MSLYKVVTGAAPSVAIGLVMGASVSAAGVADQSYSGMIASIGAPIVIPTIIYLAISVIMSGPVRWADRVREIDRRRFGSVNWIPQLVNSIGGAIGILAGGIVVRLWFAGPMSFLRLFTVIILWLSLINMAYFLVRHAAAIERRLHR